MKIVALHRQDGFLQADEDKLEQVKKDVQKALDDGTSIAIILPPNSTLEVHQLKDDDYYDGEDGEDDPED